MNKRCVHFFGDGLWAYKSLEQLLINPNYKIAAVILRHKPDLEIKKICDEQNIRIINPIDINTLDFQTIPNAEMGISVSYDQIFKADTIGKYRYGIINLHASSLPNYKGRNVLNWALINGEDKIHITIHWVDKGVDTGPIIHQHEIKILEDETYEELLDKCYEASPIALSEALRKLEKGNPSTIIQEHILKLPILCTRRIEGDEIINWEWSSMRIHNFVRALSIDSLYARTYIDGEEIQIKRTEYLKFAPVYIDICGSVLKKEKTSFIVKTGDSYIRILEWAAKNKISLGNRLQNN